MAAGPSRARPDTPAVITRPHAALHPLPAPANRPPDWAPVKGLLLSSTHRNDCRAEKDGGDRVVLPAQGSPPAEGNARPSGNIRELSNQTGIWGQNIYVLYIGLGLLRKRTQMTGVSHELRGPQSGEPVDYP